MPLSYPDNLQEKCTESSFYSVMLCVRVAFAVTWCLSVRHIHVLYLDG